MPVTSNFASASGLITSRRQVLQLAGAATALSAWPALAALPRRAGLIDVHHHIRPPGAPAAIMKVMADWSPAGAVADMDRCGVATGIAYPGPILSGTDEVRQATARRWNEYAARLGQDFPQRFGLFASLPLPNADNCIAEIDYALDHLGADGFGVSTSYGDAWLGDKLFEPVHAKLDSRSAVVFVHPNEASCCAAAKMTYNVPIMDGSWVEWPMNTARTIMSLMVSGTLRRYPRIRWIFAHGGGVMPLLVERIKGFKDWPAVGEAGLKATFPDGIAAEFQRLYFECAQSYAHPNIDAIRTLVPDNHLLFGSDYPVFPLDHATTGFAGLDLSRSTRGAIGRASAAAILPRWA